MSGSRLSSDSRHTRIVEVIAGSFLHLFEHWRNRSFVVKTICPSSLCARRIRRISLDL